MVDTFKLKVIDTAETKQELCEKEIAHIEIHNSHYKCGYGYNMTYGGDSYYEYTEEDRQKMSEGRKKYFEDPEARQKNSEAQKKRYEDPEERRKNSEGQKKRFEDPKSRQVLSEAQKKRFEDPKSRQILSEAIKKRFEDPKERQKISEARKKYFEDPEARRKNSEGRKQYYKDISNARRKLSDGKGKNKPFDVFEKNGTYIKSFNYQFEAMEYLQNTYEIKTHIKIGEVLKGTRKSSAGFTFKYKE